MERCDFSSVTAIIQKYVNESSFSNQVYFIDALFAAFLASDEAYDFELDNGLVCRWLKGTAKVSPKITAFYSNKNNKFELDTDIKEGIFTEMYDVDMALQELYELIMNDVTISEQKRGELCMNYPYADTDRKAVFVSSVLCFAMERKFIKRDTKTRALLENGSLSPVVTDHIYDGLVPAPCKHFCGRDRDLKEVHTMLSEHSKLFIQGVAGIGKSEFAKKYAEKYRKEYTNILYFTYKNSLKKMIADCDFADDMLSDSEAVRFKKHNRFFRSLKEDTLIIIDNFNVTATTDELFSVIIKYRCKILFTKRSRFDNYTYYDLTEINDENELISLTEYFLNQSKLLLCLQGAELAIDCNLRRER